MFFYLVYHIDLSFGFNISRQQKNHFQISHYYCSIPSIVHLLDTFSIVYSIVIVGKLQIMP